MARSGLEVADIFRDHGPAWREVNRGHISLEQMKVMSAIERCRTAALGGHVARCENQGCAYHWSSSNAIARGFVTAPSENKARLSRRCGPPDQPTRTAFRSQSFACCEYNLRPTQRKLIARTRQI